MKNNIFISSTSTVFVLDDAINVVKTYEFVDGDTVNLSVKLQRDISLPLSDIQTRAIAKMIEHLKTLIPPQ